MAEVSRSDWLRRMRFKFPGTARQSTEPLLRRIEFVMGDIIIEINVEANPDVEDSTFAPFLSHVENGRECELAVLTNTKIGPQCAKELGKMSVAGLKSLSINALTEPVEWNKFFDSLAMGAEGGDCTLTELDLSSNPSIGVQEAELHLNDALSTMLRTARVACAVNLRACRLRVLPPQVCFWNVRHLDISNNIFDGADLQLVSGGGSSLQALVCRDAGSVSISGLERCTNLEKIDFSGTKLTDATLAGIASLVKLSRVLAEISVVDAAANAAPLLQAVAQSDTSVTVLDVSGCSLTNVAPEAWSSTGFAKLTTLKMRSTGLTNEAVGSLASEAALPVIVELDVSMNNLRGLSNEAFQTIVQLPKLKTLAIGNASLDTATTQGVTDALRNRLRQLKEPSELQGKPDADIAANQFDPKYLAELRSIKLIPSEPTVMMRGSTASMPVPSAAAQQEQVSVTMSREEYQMFQQWKQQMQMPQQSHSGYQPSTSAGGGGYGGSYMGHGGGFGMGHGGGRQPHWQSNNR